MPPTATSGRPVSPTAGAGAGTSVVRSTQQATPKTTTGTAAGAGPSHSPPKPTPATGGRMGTSLGRARQREPLSPTAGHSLGDADPATVDDLIRQAQAEFGSRSPSPTSTDGTTHASPLLRPLRSRLPTTCGCVSVSTHRWSLSLLWRSTLRSTRKHRTNLPLVMCNSLQCPLQHRSALSAGRLCTARQRRHRLLDARHTARRIARGCWRVALPPWPPLPHRHGAKGQGWTSRAGVPTGFERRPCSVIICGGGGGPRDGRHCGGGQQSW